MSQMILESSTTLGLHQKREKYGGSVDKGLSNLNDQNLSTLNRLSSMVNRQSMATSNQLEYSPSQISIG